MKRSRRRRWMRTAKRWSPTRASTGSRAWKASRTTSSGRSRSRWSARYGCASSTPATSTDSGAPEDLAARHARAHLFLELRRPVAEALAADLVEERTSGALGEVAHPRDRALVGIAAGGAQDVRRVPAPFHRDHHDAEAVGAPVLREGAVRGQ